MSKTNTAERSNYFNGVQWVSGEDEAYSSKSSSHEVLQRANRLRLFGHVDFSALEENKHTTRSLMNESTAVKMQKHICKVGNISINMSPDSMQV